MIIRVEQKTAGKIDSYVISGNEICGEASAPSGMMGTSNLTISISGSEVIKVSYSAYNDAVSAAETVRNIISGLSMDSGKSEIIYDNNENRIGEIKHYLGTAVGIKLHDVSLQVYKVITGNGSFFFQKKFEHLCCYDGSELIGIIEKDSKVRKYLDTYTIYTENPRYANILIALCLYNDIANYRKAMNDLVPESVNNKKITIHPEIKNKYDPMFITKIKALDGIID